MDFEVRHADGTTVKLISSAHRCAITSATQTRKLCGNDTVTINLQSATYIDFYVGDKITIFGTTYTLNQLPTVKKESERSYSYTLVFEGLQYTLIDRVFLMPDNTQGDNLMFDLAGMLRELATNINRGNSGKQYEFVLDNSLEETEYKNLSLTGKNCLQVLQQLCQEWATEFVFAEEPTRIAIYIGVAGSTFPTTFKYGRGGGVYELNREKGASDICTRLFVYGGTQNLTYYRHNRLCLPSKEKNQSYVEDATAQAVYGIKEQVKNFDDIYPNRIGTITSLSGCDYNEFIDSAMADSQFGFDLNEKWANNADDCEEWLALKGLEDTPENEAIYYNDVAGTATKYLMAGATAKIHFNTGALAGYECDLHSYTHSSQKFVLKPLVDENGYDFPSKTNAAFKLAVGDEYVILDINLPTAYKEEAESKLATEAASYFDTVCRPQPKYTLTIEPIALKHIVGPSTADTEIFKVGDLINISDPTGGVDSATIRIDQFVRNLLDPFDYKLTLTDEITYSQQVRTLIEVDAIKRVVEESKIYDVNRIRRGWKDAEELYNQMFDTEGHYYSEKIAPLSIDTQMLKVGARSQQLVLQNVLFQPNYNADPANLQISAGSLVHYTIAEPDIKTWTMSAYSGSNVPSTAQYVYAKCAKNGTTGTWLVTDQAIISDIDPSYYHFLVGSLSSVDSVSNTRNFAATYGYTTINGRYITTGVIKSSDGSSVVIDLNAGIITGKIKFRTSQGTYVNAETYIGETAEAAAQTAVDNLEIGGRNLLAVSKAVIGNNSGLTPSKLTDGWFHIEGTITGTSAGLPRPLWGEFTEANTIAKNGIYTLSIETGGTMPISDKYMVQIYSYASGGTSNGRSQYITTPNGKLTIDLTGRWLLRVVMYKTANATGTVVNGDIRFKLERGNKATDWTPAPEDTEAELAALQADLQNQIDGKIETWLQVADPSSAWTTTALKDKHINDLWYYTGESTDTRTNNKTYKYTKSGSTYSWAEYSAGGGDLFDRIDGKAAIFYGSPSGTYEDVEEGDFLVDGETGISYKRLNNAWVKVQDYQEAIANIKIGGANLLPTLNVWENGSWNASTGAHSTTNTRIRCTKNNYFIPITASTDYVISRHTLASASKTYQIVIYAYDSSGNFVSADSKTSWQSTFPIKYKSATATRLEIGIRHSDDSAITADEAATARIQIEKGNKATDWKPAAADTEAALTALQTDLQGQIDRKIETYYQTASPSTNWTSAEKTAHTGDLWYYTGEDSGSLKKHSTYRWNGTAWVEQQAPEEIFDKIDGKSAIFYGSPTDTYTGLEEGDFLVDSTTNICYKWNGSSWDKVQDVQVGGKNLLIVKDAKVGTANSIVSTKLTEGWFHLAGTFSYGTYPETRPAFGNFTEADTPAKDGIYTLSIQCDNLTLDGNFRVVVGSYALGSTSGRQDVFLAQSNGSITIDLTGRWLLRVLMHGNPNANGKVINGNIRFKLEKGNRATDWTPTPEDQQEYVDEQRRQIENGTKYITDAMEAARQDEGEIEGGLILGTFIGVRNNGVLAAALNGATTGDEPMIQSGMNVDPTNMPRGTFRVYPDGHLEIHQSESEYISMDDGEILFKTANGTRNRITVAPISSSGLVGAEATITNGGSGSGYLVSSQRTTDPKTMQTLNGWSTYIPYTNGYSAYANVNYNRVSAMLFNSGNLTLQRNGDLSINAFTVQIINVTSSVLVSTTPTGYNFTESKGIGFIHKETAVTLRENSSNIKTWVAISVYRNGVNVKILYSETMGNVSDGTTKTISVPAAVIYGAQAGTYTLAIAVELNGGTWDTQFETNPQNPSFNVNTSVITAQTVYKAIIPAIACSYNYAAYENVIYRDAMFLSQKNTDWVGFEPDAKSTKYGTFAAKSSRTDRPLAHLTIGNSSTGNAATTRFSPRGWLQKNRAFDATSGFSLLNMVVLIVDVELSNGVAQKWILFNPLNLDVNVEYIKTGYFRLMHNLNHSKYIVLGAGFIDDTTMTDSKGSYVTFYNRQNTTVDIRLANDSSADNSKACIMIIDYNTYSY